ncbi:MAG TPA: hypothetical protein VFO51_01865, partial [Sphingomicrobium sp.]|nr:hypothetical protein [Sphingomicrobium sp.]
MLKKLWAAIGHAFTLQALLLFVFPTGVIVSLAVWLATLTAIVRLFAPLSYLVVAVLVLIFALIVMQLFVSVAKQLGWKPKRRPSRRKLPKRDASLAEVAKYVATESAYGQASNAVNAPVQDMQKELMDRICENELTVWGRVGQLP